MQSLDETHAPGRKSWVETANCDGCEFPIQNLPLGIFSHRDAAARFGIAIGDCVLDVAAAADAGLLLGDALPAARLAHEATLNGVFALDPAILTALRRQVADLLDDRGPRKQQAMANRAALLAEQSQCEFYLPAAIGDYTDFYSGIHHARATGAMLRPDDPLP